MMNKQLQLEQINEKIKDGISEISDMYDLIPWEKREVYAQWLAQTYFYTRHATRIISWAAAKTPHTHEWVHLKLIKLIEEEKNHEELAHHDLRNLNFSLDEFSEFSSTTAYYSTLYHLIEHQNPLCIFGYFSILEGLALTAGVKLYQYVEKQYGKNTTSFLKVHCVADVKHFEEDISILAKFNEKELDVIERSVDLSISLYKTMIKELTEKDGAVQVSFMPNEAIVRPLHP